MTKPPYRKKCRQSREKCVIAMARCVDALVNTPLLDASGPIRAALEADDRVWDHLQEETKDLLLRALGIREYRDV